ncbi:MAG: outer membrane beta-barrel protein [Methylocystis sp.]
MKNLLTSAAIALALCAGPAFAADLPSRKEAPAPVYVPPPPPPLWTGFYAGLNAGGTFGGSNSVTLSGGGFGTLGAPSAAQIASFNGVSSVASGVIPTSNGGFIGGGQAGYNWQFNSFVLGFETDIQGLAGSSSSSSVAGAVPLSPPLGAFSAFGTASASQSLDYLGTVRGRVGYLFTPTLLVYGTGGLAYGGANLSTSGLAIDGSGVASPVFGGSTYSDTRVGWTAGGGLEWMFHPNWSAKIEYLYYDLGTLTTNPGVALVTTPTGVAFGAVAQQASAQFNGHIVRAGLNYHFNWGAPAPALSKY